MSTGSSTDPVPAVAVAVAVAVVEVDPARVTLAAASAASLWEKKRKRKKKRKRENKSTVLKVIKKRKVQYSEKVYQNDDEKDKYEDGEYQKEKNSGRG